MLHKYVLYILANQYVKLKMPTAKIKFSPGIFINDFYRKALMNLVKSNGGKLKGRSPCLARDQERRLGAKDIRRCPAGQCQSVGRSVYGLSFGIPP